MEGGEMFAKLFRLTLNRHWDFPAVNNRCCSVYLRCSFQRKTTNKWQRKLLTRGWAFAYKQLDILKMLENISSMIYNRGWSHRLPKSSQQSFFHNKGLPISFSFTAFCITSQCALSGCQSRLPEFYWFVYLFSRITRPSDGEG